MSAHLIFATEHWLISHRRDARYPGYLMVSSHESQSELSALSNEALQELGLVLKNVEILLHSLYSPCKVVFYKLGFSNGFNCHFHVAPITTELLFEIAAHPDYANEPDGNDAILFLSRVYCERHLTNKEEKTVALAVENLRKAADTSFSRDG
jgi:diadenosine tetraphosphate (Ap4A) HIT family hydrolase